MVFQGKWCIFSRVRFYVLNRKNNEIAEVVKKYKTKQATRNCKKHSLNQIQTKQESTNWCVEKLDRGQEENR